MRENLMRNRNTANGNFCENAKIRNRLAIWKPCFLMTGPALAWACYNYTWLVDKNKFKRIVA